MCLTIDVDIARTGELLNRQDVRTSYYFSIFNLSISGFESGHEPESFGTAISEQRWLKWLRFPLGAVD